MSSPNRSAPRPRHESGRTGSCGAAHSPTHRVASRSTGRMSPVVALCQVAVWTVFAVFLATAVGGCGRGGGLTAGSSAPPLPEYNEQNVYDPYYVTGEMAIPRYMHRVIRLATGLVLAVGGTDESGFSALDSVELFDQSTIKRDEKEPESKTGTWFDTNFEGDPMVMTSGRLLHTLTELPDNRIIVIGGTANLNLARPIPQAEIFDPLTRTFTQVDNEMVEPRFRHEATVLDDGRIMITGGQIHTIFTESQDATVVGGGQQGNVQIQIQRDIFPSTRMNEVFSIIDDSFIPLTLPDTDRQALLTTSRGRAGHVVAKFAGPDNRLDTGDDLFLLVGGFQTLSGENAPQAKFPGLGQGGLQQLEFYDPVVGVFTEVPVIRMFATRINDPQATNLGVYNEVTPDGVLGMGNSVLVTHGDNDAPVGGRVSSPIDEVYIATFTGFGPAQGLQFFRQDDPYLEHIQGIEAAASIGGDPATPAFETLTPPGRTTTNIVVLPHRLGAGGGNDTQTWVFAGGGAHVFIIPPNIQVTYFGGTVAAGCLFDPFYSLTAVFDFDSSARDLRPGRRNSGNPLGIIGTWLVVDGLIPTTTLEGFGDTAFGNYPALESPHAWTRLINIAGEDGIVNTVDDRILFVGGGQDVFAPGGEPSFPSTEILLIPGTGSDR